MPATPGVSVTSVAEPFLLTSYVPALAAYQQVQAIFQNIVIVQMPLILTFVQGWNVAIESEVSASATTTIIRQINGAVIDTGANVYSNASTMTIFLQAMETLGYLASGTQL
jgi:hypothetical protein